MVPVAKRRWASPPEPDPASAIERWVDLVWDEATHVPCVLLAISDPALRTACRSPLVAASYAVSESDTATSAAGWARLSPPDVALFELRNEEGWGALQSFREAESTAAVPVVGLLDHVGEAEIWYSRRLRVPVLVLDSFAPDELLDAVAALLPGAGENLIGSETRPGHRPAAAREG